MSIVLGILWLTQQYDIIVLFNDISEKNQNRIKWGARKHSNISIRFIRVCEYFDNEKLFVDQHLSVETYYRLIIPEIMPAYNRILYLDCDMVTDHDVAELYDIELNGCIIGAAKDIDVAGQVNLKQNNWDRYAVEELKLASPYDYFQAGVLILDLELLRRTASSEEMIRIALSRSWRCHDQYVLNMVCKGRVHYIPQKWNTLMSWKEPGRSRMDILKMAPRKLYEEYIEARRQPYMIHFAGYQKPWDVADCDFAEYFWEYAIRSPFYIELLKRNMNYFEGERVNESSSNILSSLKQNKSVRRIANSMLPIGSHRREIIKAVFKRI